MVLVLVARSASAAEEPPQPNILWLVAEDLSPRLSCYGDTTVQTPNLDRLAAEGVRFDRAFATTGVCAPARHTIITGLYAMQSGAQYMRTGSRTSAIDEIRDRELRRRALERPLYEATPPAGVRCFPEYLRMAGYYCVNNSKEDYQFKAPVTVWDDSSRKAHYRNRAPGQPFFAVFNNNVTHESGVHGNGRRPRRVDRATVPVPSFLPDTEVVREDIARHYDNLLALDAWIGKMLRELEEAGLAKSTYVFFYGDHGDGLPRHKRWVYDSGTRVPLIVRSPDGSGSGSVDDGLMSFIDFAPTVLSLAGVERPSYMPGRVFAGPEREPAQEYVFMNRDRMDDTSFETTRSARDERYRYVRNYQPQRPYLQPVAYRDRAATMGEVYRVLESGDVPEPMWQWAVKSKPIEELYDTQADPDEVQNLAADPAYAETKARLAAALEAWVERIDDPLAADELEVIRTRIWPPEGRQPTTAAAEARLEGSGAARRVVLESATEGASIGYRVGGAGSWTVYAGPFQPPAEPFETVAHRIGWKPARAEVSLAD